MLLLPVFCDVPTTAREREYVERCRGTDFAHGRAPRRVVR